MKSTPPVVGAAYPLGHDRKTTPLVIEPRVSDFIDQRLIHWAMKSTPPSGQEGQELKGTIKSQVSKGQELKGTIKSQVDHTTIRVGRQKNDSTGNQTQSLWFRRPAPYPLSHEVNPRLIH